MDIFALKGAETPFGREREWVGQEHEGKGQL